ncbi:MAG: hypothetical protein IID48_19220 [Proteobacteria bacterium]|nr:hypothetical protein [Pseudomonadota bacterium]
MAKTISDQLQEQVDVLEAKRVKQIADLARLEGRISGLHDAIQLVLQPVGSVQPPSKPTESRVPDPSRSRGWAYVLRTLEQAPEAGLSVGDLLEGAKSKRIKLQRNTLRSWLSHAFREKQLERVSMGFYRLPASKSPSAGNGHDDKHEAEAPGDSESPGASIESGSLPLNQ